MIMFAVFRCIVIFVLSINVVASCAAMWRSNFNSWIYKNCMTHDVQIVVFGSRASSHGSVCLWHRTSRCRRLFAALQPGIKGMKMKTLTTGGPQDGPCGKKNVLKTRGATKLSAC